MTPTQQIIEEYKKGYSALLLSGRGLHDLIVSEDGKILTVVESLRRALRSECGALLIRYSLAGGLDWDESRIDDDRDRRAIENALRAHNLLDITPDRNEVVRVMRGVHSLSRSPTTNLRWADGSDMRFAFLFEFGEHLAPASPNGSQTDQQIITAELAHILAQSMALRGSGNCVMIHARETHLDELVSAALHRVRLKQPDEEEKRVFLEATLPLYKRASFEDGLTVQSVAKLMSNTPNRSLENLLLASHRSNVKLSAHELAELKRRSVEELSEGTLLVLDTNRVADLQLYGINSMKPLQILQRFGEALLKGDTSLPANVLLTGAPGTGKTDMALAAARQGRAPAFALVSPKSGLVGETERKARSQQLILKEWTPNVAFCDEIDSAFPLERNDYDGDSGASAAVRAALLSALSDESRRGQSLLIGTTNRPSAMGAALKSRFTVVPCLLPLAQDYPGIIVATARRVATNVEVGANDSIIKEAAHIFYNKGATARDIRVALSNALLLHGALTPDAILFASRDLRAATDYPSAIFSELESIKACSSIASLPWSDQPVEYPYPPHLQGIVDPRTGSINETELNKRIEDYRPHAKV